MKASQEIKEVLKKDERDWEAYHSDYDDIIIARLRTLDPEFVADMEKISEDATFWYA